VAERSITSARLDGVAKRVAVVQAFAHARAFGLVARNHARFEHDTTLDGLGCNLGVPFSHGLCMIEQPKEEGVGIDDG